MSRRDKSAKQDGEGSAIDKGVARPEAGMRGWATANKLDGGARKIATGRKIPSGPVGGSGRKTNLSRSS